MSCRELISLDDIINEPFYERRAIFLDTNILTSQSLTHDLLKSNERNFFFDRNQLTLDIEYLKDSIKLMRANNTYTIKEVTFECDGLCDFLECTYFNIIYRRSNALKDSSQNINEKAAQSIELMYESAVNIHNSSIDKELNFHDYQQFQDILDLVILIRKRLNLKEDRSKVYNKNKKNKRTELLTDEKLVASMLYLSCYEDINTAVATRDYDIRNMLSLVPKVLLRPELSPHNQALLPGLSPKRLTLYFGYQQNCDDGYLTKYFQDKIPVRYVKTLDTISKKDYIKLLYDVDQILTRTS